jgi:hypothetical protein
MASPIFAPGRFLRLSTALACTVTAAAAAAGGSSCDEALIANCDAARHQGTFQCGACAGQHQHDLQAAGCNTTYIEKFCSNQACILDPFCAEARAQGSWECTICIGEHFANVSSSCSKEQEQSYCNFQPPHWTPGGCCSLCPYQGINTKCMGVHDPAGYMGKCNSTSDPHASCQLPGYVTCAKACSMTGTHAYCENHASCQGCAAYVYADAANCKTPCDFSC